MATKKVCILFRFFAELCEFKTQLVFTEMHKDDRSLKQTLSIEISDFWQHEIGETWAVK